ncbi:hypothetical protein LCGC14_2948170, partial [marine sediment metagenome]
MQEEKDLGTAYGDPEHDPGPEPAPADEGATEPAREPAVAEGFFNLDELSEEERSRFKPAWAKMQGAYTKKLEGVRQSKDKVDFVDRLFSDEQFALQQAADLYSRLGYQVPQAQGPAQKATPSAATGSGVTAPQHLVDSIRAQLKPEIQWMAEDMANSSWTAAQTVLAPLARERDEESKRTRDDEFSEVSEKLTTAYPGWEQHEDEMDALLDFMKSKKMTDRRFGSK